MLSSFPQSADLIRSVRDQSVTVFHADHLKVSRPFTVQTDSYPIVVLCYRGRIVDLLTVAHEFGHAVQSLASGPDFVPPVNREICAFVSELALLKMLRSDLPARSASL